MKKLQLLTEMLIEYMKGTALMKAAPGQYNFPLVVNPSSANSIAVMNSTTANEAAI